MPVSPFTGRWSLVGADNVAAFHDAIKTSEDYKDKLRQLAEAVKKDRSVYVEELSVDGPKFRRQAFVNGEKRKDSGEAVIGPEVDSKTADGRPAKVRVTLESENKVIRTEKGDGFSSTSTFEVRDDELIVTMMCGSVTAKEKFRKIN